MVFGLIYLSLYVPQDSVPYFSILFLMEAYSSLLKKARMSKALKTLVKSISLRIIV